MCNGLQTAVSPATGTSNDSYDPRLSGVIFSAHEWSTKTIQESETPRRKNNMVIHNYHDHSHEVYDGSPEPVARGGVTTAFPIKLHEMLDKIEQDGYGHVVSWQPHGRCFVVHKPKEFVDHVMPTYFKQSKFPSFQRQLNLYGFQRLTKGSDKGGYYHELFLRGRVFLSHRIQRTRVKGTGVRARSNPTTEPNFCEMDPVSYAPPAREASTLASQLRNSSASLVTPELSLLEAPSIPFDKDIIADIDGIEFHLLDPEDYDDCQNGEDVQSFFGTLNISKDLYHDISERVRDDQVFGDLLQHIIA